MKINLDPIDIGIINDINKYDLNKENIYNFSSTIKEFSIDYDKKLKNLK